MPRIDDGYQTLITLANDPTLKIYEKEVTPPGYQGGGPIDTTTMRNETLRTASPKSLKTLSPMTIVAAYETEAYADLRDQINENQLITVTFPDGASLHFWGWVDEFTPGALTEGEQPTATVTIIPSNHDEGTPQLEVAAWWENPTGSAF